jgi:hypothetical protein
MNKNVGSFDKMARIIMGIVIIGIGFYFKSWWGAIGIIPIFTAFIGWCPIYAPFKIHTNKSSSD